MQIDEYEEKGEAKGEDEQVRRWLSEIGLSDKTEKGWREDAKRALDVYASEVTGKEGEKKEAFNILWANTEIKRQALYNTLPVPDIRRRFGDKDPVAKAVSEILERSVAYTLDCGNFDEAFANAVLTMILPGRAVTRIKYRAAFEKDEEGQDTDTIQSEKVECEQVQWDDFIRGPGKTWPEVPWIAFKHKLTKDEVKAKWPEFAEKITYDVAAVSEGASENKTDSTVYKRACVYEIWDKDSRKVIWIAKEYADSPLEVVDDPLELSGFWPIPEPLVAIERPDSLIPITEYSQYCLLAKELESITRRRSRIVSAMRVRGVYDSTLAEMSKIFEADDNDFIPAENLSRLIEAGGIEKAIWMMPLDKLIIVYRELGMQRQALISEIYELTGISDIIRGNTNPNETLGAQQIKANFGSMRLDRQRQAVQRYIRDIVRIVAEIISEKFDRATLASMTGMNFPTEAEKMQVQGQIQLAAMQAQIDGNQAPLQQLQAQAQAVLSKPSWEDIEQVLKSDLQREYRIDIETDSTIVADVQRDQQAMTEFMNGMGQLFKYSADGINSGILTIDLAKKTVAAFMRKFKLGREVEDELENSMNQPAQANPQAEAAQAQAQAEQQKMQMEMQRIQAESQAAMQKLQAETQAYMAKIQGDMQAQAMKLEAEQQKIVAKQEAIELERQKLAIEREQMITKAGVKAQELQMDIIAQEANRDSEE